MGSLFQYFSKFWKSKNYLSNKEENLIKDIEKLLGYKIQKHFYYLKALTHRSYLEILPSGSKSNERLEFLGDAVLDLIVAEYLFLNFPEDDEGELTKIRSRLVDRIALSDAANLLKIDRFLLIEESFHANIEDSKKTIRADALEALIGAIYLDTGLENTKNFVVENIIKPSLNKGNHQIDKNYKGQLLELTHSNKLNTPLYKIIQEEGPEHNKLFLVSVIINDEQYGIGEGKNKKTAEQNAAKAALQKLSQQNFPKLN